MSDSLMRKWKEYEKNMGGEIWGGISTSFPAQLVYESFVWIESWLNSTISWKQSEEEVHIRLQGFGGKIRESTNEYIQVLL